MNGLLPLLLLEAGLQLKTQAGVAALQSAEEEVRLLLKAVQVALGVPVLPEELLGAQRDVQQAGLAQDVVGVAEALPLCV